jgi:chromosomal replication initiator protein
MCEPKRKSLGMTFMGTEDRRELIEIIEAVEIVTGMNFDDFNVKTRTQQHVEARFLFMHFVYTRMRLTLKMIGELMGGRDHSTVIHGVQLVSDWIANKKFYTRENKLIDDITRHLERSAETQG